MCTRAELGKYKLQPHPPRLLGHIPSQRHSSFQLLSIILTYKLNSLFSACPGLIFIGNNEKKKQREWERQEVLWSYTHAKIATVNIHTKKVALSESAKVDQISSLAFSRFRYRSYHTVGECVGFWEKNTCLKLVRARMQHGLISALRWKRKDSRLRRFLNCHKYFKKATYSSQHRCGCHESLFAGAWMIAHKQKGSDQFMRISNNNTEYSRYEYFDLTRMFNKLCFCDSNIPNSHGWLHLNYFPRFIVSK